MLRMKKNDFTPLVEPLPFEEAIEFFKTKVPIKPAQYYRIANEWKARAFTVGGITSLDMLNKFMEALQGALEEGKTIQQFRKEMNDFLESKGYEGLTPFQADNVFRTNIQTAYNVGHYKQMTDPEVKDRRPYWRYDAVNDNRTRLSHQAMDGKIFPNDHPVWDTWYPPNGFKCRCTVVSLTKAKVERLGLKVETDIPKLVQPPGRPAVPLIPDKGFDKNPAIHAWEPDLSKYPKPLKEAYEKRAKGGDKGEK